MSYQNTLSLRLIFAIVIVFFHAGTFFEFQFYNLGSICVAAFFFLSGYGLVYSQNNKLGYIMSFLQRRIPGILIPFWMCVIITTLVTTIVLGTYTSFIHDLLSGLLGYPHWFVMQLLLFYVAFYFSFLMFKGRRAIVILSILCILIMASLAVFFNSGIYLPGVGFIVGMAWASSNGNIEKFIKGGGAVLVDHYIIHHFTHARDHC